MKKLILSIALITGISVIGFAQDGGRLKHSEESRKKIEASKMAYMTSYLDLTSEESAEFWPIYNEYQKALRALKPERGERKMISEMTEAEATEKLNQQAASQAKKAQIHDRYIDKFRTVLSDKKILMLQKAEGEFKRQVLKRYADRRRGGFGGSAKDKDKDKQK